MDASAAAMLSRSSKADAGAPTSAPEAGGGRAASMPISPTRYDCSKSASASSCSFETCAGHMCVHRRWKRCVPLLV